MEEKYKLEDRVILVHSSYLNLHGVLKYKGQIEGTPPGVWFGVDLDEPKGKNAGDHKDVFYFKCEAKHGVFVRINNLRLESEGEVENESPSKLSSPSSKTEEKQEKPSNEPLLKMLSSNALSPIEKTLQKPTLEKIPQEKAQKFPTKTVEKPAEKEKQIAKPTEEKPKLLEKPEKKLSLFSKDPKPLALKKSALKEPSTLVKKPTLAEKKPLEKPGEKKVVKKAVTIVPGAITKKPTLFAKKTATNKNLEEETKSIDSKDEVEGEEEGGEDIEETVETRQEESEDTSNFNPESTQQSEEGKSDNFYEALKTEVDEKSNELALKNSEIKELNKNLTEMAKKIQSYEKEKEKINNSADFENLNNIKLMQMEQKLKEAERKNKHLESDYARLKKEFDLQKDHMQQHENFTHMVEGLTIENENLKANIDALSMEMEEGKTEIRKLKDENEMIQLEMEEAMEMPQISEESSTATLEQLKENNGKLRLAIQILNEKYENEQIFHYEQIERYKLALERIPELQQKVKELDEKKQLLSLKEQEVEELKNRLDEGSEYQDMIEMLTNDLMKKEEEIIDLKRAIKDLKEERDVNNQLIEANEDENKELNRILEAKDQEILGLCKRIKDREDAIEECEKLINKFREKIAQTNKELEMFKDNAQKTGGEESRNMKRIEELLQKQLEILSEKREIYKKMLNYNVMNFRLSNEVLTCNTFLKTLPSIFLEKLHLEAFNKFIMIRTIRGKTRLLLEELQETFIKPQQAKDNIDLVNWVSKGLIYMNNVVYCLNIVELAMIFLNSEEEYLEFTKNSFFGTCIAIQVIIDSMLKTHREEAMSVKIPTEPLKILSNKLMEQVQVVIKKYMDRESEELIGEAASVKNFIHITKILYKNKYEMVKFKIYIENIWLTCLNRECNLDKFEKTVMKINDTLDKISRKIILFLQIKNKQEGFIVISRVAIEKILAENVFHEAEELEIYEIVSILAEYYEKITDDFISDKENYHLMFKDIFDKLENLFGKLVVTVPNIKRYSLSHDGNLIYDPMSLDNDNIDEFQGMNNRVFGPWDLCSQKMNEELKKVLENVDNFEKMSIELTEQVKKLLRLEEELKGVNIVKESLEIRVADLQNKAERVVILENDKRRLIEKEQHFNEATEAIKRELENAEQKNRELEEEMVEIRSGSNLGSLPQESGSSEAQQGGFGRKSMFKPVFRETLLPYSRISLIGGGEKSPSGEMMRGMTGGSMVVGNVNVESVDSLECWDIIQKLLAENCYLKGSEMREKLEKLKRNMPKFSRYHQEIKLMNQTGGLQHNLINLANKMNGVQKKAQKKLIEAKIVDLENISDLSIVQKNENLEKFLRNANKGFESIKNEAYGVSFQLYKNFRADIDEHRFETHLESGLQEALKSIQNLKKVASLEFVNGEEGSSASNSKLHRIVLNQKEYADFTQKLVI